MEIASFMHLHGVKKVSRSGPSMHLDNQRETVAEHLASCTRTALIIMESIPEFKDLNRLKVFGILAFHDEPEVITNDKSVDQKTVADKADELRAL